MKRLLALMMCAVSLGAASTLTTQMGMLTVKSLLVTCKTSYLFMEIPSHRQKYKSMVLI